MLHRPTRRSSTLKITRNIAQLIARFTDSSAGVIVRHRGNELGTMSVDGMNAICSDGAGALLTVSLSQCTIPRATVIELETRALCGA